MPDPIHLHLLVNHVPVMGTWFVLLLLLIAWIRRSEEITRLGLWLTVLLGAATAGVFLTGDPAAHALRLRLGTALRPFVHAHDDAAGWAMTVTIVTAVAAAVALFLGRRGAVPRFWLGITIALALFATAVVARAAYLGGLIRHDEIRGGTVSPSPSPGPPLSTAEPDE